MAQAYDVPKNPAKPKVRPPHSVQGTKVTILGCGTSTGVPLLACTCPTCRSRDPRNKRLRSSVSIQVRDKVFLIDTTPDLREQGLRNRMFWIDAVLFTHPHADHTHGIDELRSYNYLMTRRIDCYGNAWTLGAIRNKFDYIFKKTQKGGGKPLIDLHRLRGGKTIAGIRVIPLECSHGNLGVLGYRIGDVAYLTDITEIPSRTLPKLRGLKLLVLDCLRYRPHPTHLNVTAAIELAKKIGAKKTVFTHMGHEVEYKTFARSLPENMTPAFDGLVIHI